MNKKHWNSIYIDGSVPDKEIIKWIDHSYNLVIEKK
jgi:predicted DNA-binding protein (MmcQ/YjbR family)